MIDQLLDQLADMQAQLDAIRLHYDDLRKQVITPEIQAQLDDIYAEEHMASEAAQTGIAALTDQVKAAVLAAGATVKGKHLQAIWQKGRVSWDTKALDGYAAGHPELLPFRKEGEPSVSIRAVK